MNQRKIVHIEIPSTNREHSGQFYKALFGWEYQHSAEPMVYTSFRANGTGGGYPDVGDHYHPGDVTIYIESTNIEADLNRIETLGGKRISECFPVSDIGFMAYFEDPSGNRLALWHDLHKE